MRLLTLPLLALIAAACTGEDPAWNDHDLDSDSEPDEDSEPDSEPDDTEPTGTDADGDGWTVEAGDCDDDNIQVNPAWTETGRRATDGLDNDCDGWVDESLGAIAVIDVDTATGAAQRLRYDGFGDLGAAAPLPNLVNPTWSDQALDRRGRVLLDREGEALWQVNADGTAARLVDFADEALALDLPLGVAGVGTDHRGQAYFVGAVDRLLRVAPLGDGWEVEEVGRWDCHIDGVCEATSGQHELAAWDLAIDPARGTLRLAGAFGAGGAWEAGALHLDVAEDPDAPAILFLDMQAHGARGFYALGEDTDGFGVWRWNDAQARWALRGRWPEPDRPPSAFGLDDETGDFYISANWGWTQEIWRMVADGTYTARLVPAPGVPYTEAQTHRYRAIWVEPTEPTQ